MVACCTKVTLSDDNVRNLTASYAMKEQPMSKSFLNALFFFFFMSRSCPVNWFLFMIYMMHN